MKWEAHICHDKTKRHLGGLFKDKIEAKAMLDLIS
jgi:hypothetical protein